VLEGVGSQCELAEGEVIGGWGHVKRDLWS
jgi:hypothetical protein